MSAPRRYRGFLIRRTDHWYLIVDAGGHALQVCTSWQHACRVIDAMKGVGQTDLDRLCTTKGVRALTEYGNRDHDKRAAADDWTKTATPWTVRLRYQGRTLTVPFWTGPAITHEPSAADVLFCIVSDTYGYEDAQGFEDWCSAYGYDPDSRKAKAMYRQVEALAGKVKRFLENDLDTFASVSH
jgi:hypothetical protein